MTISEMLYGIKGCECGRDHECPISHVIIAKDAITALPSVTEHYEKILLVADTNTLKECGETVLSELGDKICDTLIFKRDGILVPDEIAVSELDSRVSDDTDLIIGVGSGVINDLCKIVSYNNGIPYIIVATAPSMDGYASVGSALILNGMKVTLNARVPIAIVADTKVLANSPFAMIQAGYGDIIGKYSCLCDWQLSALVNDEYICPRILELTYAAVERTVALTDKIIARSEDAIGALMEALVAIGILMAYVGNSRPASGSEHHLSHYFEIVGLERNEEYLPHGIDVAFSSLETAKLREKLLSIESLDGFECHFSRERYEREINRIYGSVASEVIALQDKVGWYGIDRTDVYREKWQEIRQVLSNAPTADETLALLDRAGLKYSDFLDLYGKEKIDDALLYAKDLKDRYSVLWIYFDLLADI